MAGNDIMDYEAFRKDILHKTGVSFCTRMHFGRPLPGETEFYIRIAYAGIGLAELTEGLGRLKTYALGAKVAAAIS